MRRKTIEVSKIINFLNTLIMDDDFLERDRQILCAIAEVILDETGNPVAYEKFAAGDYDRKYILK